MNDSKTGMPAVLLVENNENDVLLVRRSFERAGFGHQVQSVGSGQDAIAYLRGNPPYDDRGKFPLPGLLLLDIKMPGMDGFEVLQWIRRQWEFSHLCVAMLTTSDEIRDVNRAYKLGADSFLVKPLDFENAAELFRSLDSVLARGHS
ncbi:MAG TPA: response regulator [Verrucomicrobiae bacterium]|nr:response regulator [Verrucomicrobiae bacterium]